MLNRNAFIADAGPPLALLGPSLRAILWVF
jgi:hypothetical protein